MEKLIELLNEYDNINKHHNNWFRNEYGHLDRTYGWSTVLSSCWKVISKEYGFIKWLVDNDKIDKVKQVIKDIDIWGSDTITGVDTYSDYESLLMLLAIQENAIEFLISILK